MESVDFGLFTLRLLVGGIFIGHGLIKFTERFGGLGRARAGAVFEQLGYRPARLFLIAAGLTEPAAGSAFIAGLLTPLATAALVGVMVNTIGSSKAGHGPWYFNGGWEYDLTLLITASAVTFTGPGDISLDAAVGLDATGWGWGAAALAVGVAAGQAVLALRQRLADSATTPEAAA
jgi:putative oxidoreductase